MANVIKDGKGSGYKAGVDSNNRLETLSTTLNRSSDASKRTGNSFVLASDFISLTTTGSFNAIMYLKNEGDSDIYIEKIRTCSTATGSMQFYVVANPTAGTIVSDANASLQRSINMSSNLNFSDIGKSYSASGDGKTLTDGSNFSQFINRSPGHSIQEYDGALIIPKSSSIGLTCKPSVATTMCAEIQCWAQ